MSSQNEYETEKGDSVQSPFFGTDIIILYHNHDNRI